MKEFKMRFKDFVFDTNPSYIQVITSRDVSNTSVYDGKGITQDISQKPIIVKGKGTFSQTMQTRNALACHIF